MLLTGMSKFILDSVSILCVGSYLIKRALIEARHRPGGASLGLQERHMRVNIWWQGYGGLRLIDLKKKLTTLFELEASPNFLILHCGWNDLGLVPLFRLRLIFKDVIEFIREKAPNTRVVWSQILPRKKWRFSDNVEGMNRARIRLNSFIAKEVLQSGGAYIKHPDLDTHASALFLSDGVHLSEVGNNIFLNSLQGGIECFHQRNNSVYP